MATKKKAAKKAGKKKAAKKSAKKRQLVHAGNNNDHVQVAHIH